jgi:hypothetical protein
MVEPVHFGFNSQTAQTNPFQHNPNDSESNIQRKAYAEFTSMVNTLRKNEISVLVLLSRKDKVTPDSVFPNNWFSHFQSGELIIYPLLTSNRRAERQTPLLEKLLISQHIPISEIIDLSTDENEGHILEGTGSLVLDRTHKVVFAMNSPRTTKAELDKWCKITGYQGVFFNAYDANSFPIYHTNVTMNIGQDFAVACLESIKDLSERSLVENSLKLGGKEVIDITIEQMYKFCGNILQLVSNNGLSKIVMSETAFNGFTPNQLNTLQKYGEIVSVCIPTIEEVGGGSARCMLAEVFSN